MTPGADLRGGGRPPRQTSKKFIYAQSPPTFTDTLLSLQLIIDKFFYWPPQTVTAYFSI